ncbi:S-adenosyl-L-methionine-dependent methyltransferase [Spinellus fusiger]|nr:S-adenosyl-L-methionine-dependent methyltransferase [Spinellus fusiger]
MCSLQYCLQRALPSLQRTYLQRAHYGTFQHGDFCMLRDVRNNKKFFVGPLETDSSRNVKGVLIAHTDILHQPARTIVRGHKGNTGYMLHFPTLEEYVLNVPRACTPIYPKDASTIIHLLDIEPGHRILEAGTGNGALTLYLARAVGPGKVDTFELNETHSKTAIKHVTRFQRGRYLSAIDFHSGNVVDVLPGIGQLDSYDGIVLDMPEPNLAWPTLLPYLKNDRFLVCYLPNMTQVLSLMEKVRGQPLAMESCMEIEWKEWEVRATQLRNRPPEEEGESSLAWVCRPKNFEVRGHTAFLVKLRKCDAVQPTSSPSPPSPSPLSSVPSSVPDIE